MNGYKWSAVSNIWNSITSAKAYYFQLGRTRPLLGIGPNVRSSGFPIRWQLVKALQVQIKITPVDHTVLEYY